MLVSDGEFLIRESVKKPGQYVLTGMAAGKVQHLLLMDKQGKVCYITTITVTILSIKGICFHHISNIIICSILGELVTPKGLLRPSSDINMVIATYWLPK